MTRTISFLITMALVLLLGSMIGNSDGFQIAAPKTTAPTLQKHHLSSTLFVAPRPATTITGMSYNGAEQGDMELGLKFRIRNFFMALWRFLTLPLRLFRNNDDSAEEGPYIDTTSLQEAPTSTWESVNAAPTFVAPDQRLIVDKRFSPVTAIQPRNNRAPRWAVATSDFSGEWVLMASENFQTEYADYFNNLMGSQPPGVLEAALGNVGQTEELYEQTEEGRLLTIYGNNGWTRSLVASGVDGKTDSFQPSTTAVMMDYGESVEAESWWEDGGTSHISWMRRVTNYGGGEFESKRYLESAGKVLVCETIFIPDDVSRIQPRVTWRFLKRGETL